VRTSTLARVLASDVPDTGQFVERVVPIVLASQESVVAATDAYMSLEAGMSTGTSREPWRLDASRLIGARARRGELLEDVYGRNHRATQGTFRERMAREVDTDITLAERGATYVHTEGDPRIAGYRRVLGTGKHCGLCVAASSQRYSKGDLRPIHLKCGCTTQPIYGDVRSFQRPNRARLNQLYEQAGGTGSRQLSRIKVDNPDLPEVEIINTALGPTLTRVPTAA
jgi:hypothetical protein